MITFPHVLTVDEVHHGNAVRQLAVRYPPLDGTLATLQRGRRHHLVFHSANSEQVLIVTDAAHALPGDVRVLRVKKPSPSEVDFTRGAWVKHPELSPAVDIPAELQRVRTSWVDSFRFAREVASMPGLRSAQVGAIHAAHAHWSVSEEPATIVMPTGTGKTEVMLSILVSVPCPSVLVVVPTDALRTQLSEKFLTLGMLRATGWSVLAAAARYPIVGTIEHVPKSVLEVNDVFERCHVVVTTSSILAQCGRQLQQRMAELAPYLFIDEAHHSEAPTWKAFRNEFRDRRVLQFTATPFREDGKTVDGRIIYRYTLKRAQQDGYFKPIRFSPVEEFEVDRADRAIAAKAVDELRADTSGKHLLMARVSGIDRASKVLQLYRSYPEFNPIELHGGIKSKRERDKAASQLRGGLSRIVVCVNMLGEGFDLPELKIAAFHDIKKSLPVTLQLVGRFTRARRDLGDPVFIANTANVDVSEELERLYYEDPDWNALLPELNDYVVGKQIALKEFLDGFGHLPEEIPLLRVRPATSAVAYRTSCAQWKPGAFREGIANVDACKQVYHAVNPVHHALVIVAARQTALPWIDSSKLSKWEWELYVIVWVPEEKLLFINCSANAGEYGPLARAIAGDDVELVKGQQVFKAFGGISRLLLQNVGLTEVLGRNVRYTARMGADVETGLSEVHRRGATKAVLAGHGFEGGKRVGVGASRRGRIWSHQRGNVIELVDWCRSTACKLNDPALDPDEILQGTLEEETISERPAQVPVAVDWPEEVYELSESKWWIELEGVRHGLADVTIQLVSMAPSGPLSFALATDSAKVELELRLYRDGDSMLYRFAYSAGGAAKVLRGENAEPRDVCAFFLDNPPLFWFADGSTLAGNAYVRLRNAGEPYDSSKIVVWNWSGTDITSESQGVQKDAASIQARVIRELQQGNHMVIFDDDGKGEVADVVAAQLFDQGQPSEYINLEFYHCKYSSGAAPGSRVKDLYEVCGQAQKCISWLRSSERRTEIFSHLLARESKRASRGQASRLECGTTAELKRLRDRSRSVPVRVKVFAVQPGLSKRSIRRDQLELLSVTENHLAETYQVPFTVIASD